MTEIQIYASQEMMSKKEKDDPIPRILHLIKTRCEGLSILPATLKINISLEVRTHLLPLQNPRLDLDGEEIILVVIQSEDMVREHLKPLLNDLVPHADVQFSSQGLFHYQKNIRENADGPCKA